MNRSVYIFNALVDIAFCIRSLTKSNIKINSDSFAQNSITFESQSITAVAAMDDVWTVPSINIVISCLGINDVLSIPTKNNVITSTTINGIVTLFALKY